MDRFQKKNLTAKIIAVVFAMILWIYVMNEQNPPIEVSFQAPLEVRNLAGNLIASDTPDYVRIRVRGPRGVVAGITAQDIKAYIDMRGLPEGVNTAKVNITVPSNIDVIEVMPDKISVKLDAVISRPVQLEIRPVGTLPAGVNIARTTANVSSVRVEGPRSQLEMLDRVVASVDVSEKSGDFTVEVPIVALNSEGKEIEGITISPKRANVTVNLSGANKKVVDIKTILVSELPKNVILRRISTDPDKVEISGDPALIDKIETVFTAPISLTNINKSADIPAKLQLREGIKAKTNNVVIHIEVESRP